VNPFALVGVATGFLSGAALLFFLGVRLATKPSRSLVGITCAIGALASAFLSAGRPVGQPLADHVYAAIFGAAITYLTSKARRRWFLAAALAAALASVGGTPAALLLNTLLGTIPFGAAISLRLEPRRPHLLQLFFGPVLAVGLLSLPVTLPTFVPTGVALFALVVLFFSASTVTTAKIRRRMIGVTFSALAAFGVATALAGFAAARARHSAYEALSATESALSSAGQMRTAEAGRQLQTSRFKVDEARRQLTVWWARPAFFVPLVGQNLRSVERLALAISPLIDSARQLSQGADPGQLRPQQGRVDLALLGRIKKDVVAVRSPLRQLARRSVEIQRNPWVISPLRDRVHSFDDRIVRLNADLLSLDESLANVSTLLGSGGVRHYLLVLPTPAEARGSGGVVGNFGEIVVENGSIRLEKFGRNGDLETAGTPRLLRKLDAPADYLERYRPFGAAFTWSNMNMSPDFPASAEAMANHYPQSGGRFVDGVISADPVALAALLQLIGPVNVPSWPEPITSANAAEVLMYRSYVDLGGKDPRRLVLLTDTALEVWTKLVTATLPSPTSLANALRPAADGRHVQIWMRDQTEQAFLSRLGLTGAVPPLDGDSFGVVVNNASANKIEWFLHRSVVYDVEYDPTSGDAHAVAQVELRNDAPSQGLPDYVIGNIVPNGELAKGDSRLYVSVYSAMPLQSWVISGVPVPFDRATELGRNVTSGWVVVPSKGTVSMKISFDGVVPNGGNGRYRLDLFQQPLVRADSVTVSVHSVGNIPLTVKSSTLSVATSSTEGTQNVEPGSDRVTLQGDGSARSVVIVEGPGAVSGGKINKR
jgi:Protein of unknown function (DUF4012)